METTELIKCKKTKIRYINQGTLFKLKPTTTAPIWVKGEFERSSGKYSCFKQENTSTQKSLNPSHDIYINF